MIMRTRMLAAVAAAVFLLPATSGAFSFGTFAPGEKIVSVQLAAGDLDTPMITFDGTTNTMVFDASVSKITTNLGEYDIPLGDVVFTSTVMIVPGTELVLQPAGSFGGHVEAGFRNGMTADLSIVDLAGSGLLLQGEYGAPLHFFANSPGGLGFAITSGLEGSFTTSGGDAAFVAAFGPGAHYSANLSGFLTGGGGAVGSNLCLLIDGGCPTGTTIASFSVNPTVTITPIPEPGVATLTAVGLALLARRRHPAR